MPIYPVVLAPDASLRDSYPRYVRTGEVLYAGLVLKRESHDIRVMSDVDSVVYYAVVWNPETKTPFSVQLHIIEFGCSNEAEIDATPDVIEAYEAWQAEQAAQAQRRYYEVRCEEARNRLRVPHVGCPARVMKGRNVPIGTEGIVTGDYCGGFGTRIDLMDAAGNTHRTAISNAERIVEQLDGEDWLDTERRLRVIVPDKWDVVRVTSGPKAGAEGTVFYLNGERVGVATSDKKADGRYVDVVWVFAANVTITERRDGRPPPVVNSTTAVPPTRKVTAPF